MAPQDSPMPIGGQDGDDALLRKHVEILNAEYAQAMSHVIVSGCFAGKLGAEALLSDEGLVELDSYRPLRLTLAGKQLAAQIRARHETVLRFLIALGVPARQAEIDAEGIEHHVGEATMRAMKRFLGGA